MPLHELYRMSKGKKLDSKETNRASCAAPDQSTAPENDFYELVWENGQVSMQGQSSSRVRKIPAGKSLPSLCLPSHSPRGQDKDVGYANGTNSGLRMGKFGDFDSGSSEPRMPVSTGDMGLNQDEDLMMPWLNYGMDDDEPLQEHGYGSDFLHELSGLTMIDLPPSNNVSLLDKRSNCNQVFKDSNRNYASHVDSNSEQRVLSKGSSASARGEFEATGHKARASQFYQPSFASGRSRVLDITENNANNATQQVPCGEIAHIFPSSSSGFSGLKMMDKQDPIGTSSSSCTVMNFTHFARPAAVVKANLQNIGLTSGLPSLRSENIGNKNRSAAVTASNPPESTKVGISGQCPKESVMHKNQVMEQSKADLKQLEPKSLEGDAVFSKQSDPAHKEDVSKIDRTSNLLVCDSSNKEQEAVEKNTSPAIASSSVCSGNGMEGGSDNANQNLKRKRRDTEDSECHSEDIDEVSAGVKNAASARGGIGSKRSRSAEVHNLSERRRRDRINEKMRALQELIPNCNKVDKASMLDEAIEYLKTLQLQVQLMSMGAGLYMHPMMLPAGMHHMHPPHMASFSPMGVGMQMGMGMGYGMGMPDINGGSSKFPMMQVPQMQGTHLPVAPIHGPSLHGMGRPNPQVFGLPGQGGLQMPMPRAPMFPFPGEPVMNSSSTVLNAGGTMGLKENVISASTSSLKDPTPNANSQVMPKANGCISTSQTTTQCEAAAGGFEHSALVHDSDPASAAIKGGPGNAVKEDNPVGKSSEL